MTKLPRVMRKAGLVVGAALGLLVAAPGVAAAEIAPDLGVQYLFSDYYVGVNWTGWSIDAMANCQRDADRVTGGSYTARCTATAYGARLDVYQNV